MNGVRPLPPALRILAQERDRAADAAIAEALPHLDPAAQEAALTVLLRRNHEPTLQGLVARYRTFEEPLREAMARGVRPLHEVIRRVAGSDNVEASESALQLVIDAKDAKLAYLLGDAVRSTRKTARELGASGLKRLADPFVSGADASGEGASAGAADGRLDAMADTLRAVVARFEPSAAFTPVEAALWLGDRVEPALLEKLHEPHGKLVEAVNKILAAPTDPRLAGALLRALATPELRVSAIRALTMVQDAAFLKALIREAWLVCDADVRRGLGLVPEGRWMDAWMVLLASIDMDDACRAVRLLCGVGGNAERKWARLRTLLDDPRGPVRREAFWQLICEPTAAATDVLRTLTSVNDAELRELSLRECRRRQASRGFADPPPAHESAASPFEAFTARFDEWSPEDRILHAEELKRTATDLPRQLQDRLASKDPVERCRAIRIAQCLGLLPAVAERVFALASDGEKIVRAAAMTALSGLPGPTSVRILRAAMNDPDDRVQANAVESLDCLRVERRVEILRPKLSSPNNRVRANAIRALLRLEVREAGDALLDMLENPSHAHRASALWVVERLQLRAVMQRVTDLGRDDEDPRVRLRAQRILRQISGRVRESRRASSRAHGDGS